MSKMINGIEWFGYQYYIKDGIWYESRNSRRMEHKYPLVVVVPSWGPLPNRADLGAPGKKADFCTSAVRCSVLSLRQRYEGSPHWADFYNDMIVHPSYHRLLQVLIAHPDVWRVEYRVLSNNDLGQGWREQKDVCLMQPSERGATIIERIELPYCGEL